MNEQREQDRNRAKGVAVEAIKAIVQITRDATTDGPTWLRLVALVVPATIILAIVVTAGALTLGQPRYAVMALAIAVACVVSIVSIVLLFQRAQAGLRTTFRRIVPALELPEPRLGALSDRVESVRREALDLVKKSAPGGAVTNEMIRASVFLADYRGLEKGYAYLLRMHERLRKQMNHDREWRIRFHPGEGATGTVFNEGDWRIVRTREFQLHDRHKDEIHPDLKRIVSMPIKGADSSTLGVLNVDGLGIDLDSPILEKVAAAVRARVAELGQILDACPKAELLVAYRIPPARRSEGALA